MSEETARKVDSEVKKIVDKDMKEQELFLQKKLMIYTKSKALLVYETLSGDEIRDLILKDKKPTRSFESDSKEDTKETSARTIGLKPKPVV